MQAWAGAIPRQLLSSEGSGKVQALRALAAPEPGGRRHPLATPDVLEVANTHPKTAERRESGLLLSYC